MLLASRRISCRRAKNLLATSLKAADMLESSGKASRPTDQYSRPRTFNAVTSTPTARSGKVCSATISKRELHRAQRHQLCVRRRKHECVFVMQTA